MPESYTGRLLDHVHLRVSDLEASRRLYAAALGALGREVKGGDDYYASYVLDLDGNNLEAVYHGPARRSAEAVVFSWDDPAEAQ